MERKKSGVAKQFARLTIAWFRTIKDDERETHHWEWYAGTVNKFYEYRELYRKCISYMEVCFPIIIDSDIPNKEKEYEYAFWYVMMCGEYCAETLYYKVNNRSLAITSSRYCGSLGYPLSIKADVVKIYDDICFEIRKFNPKFEKCGARDEDGFVINEYGFCRLDPPTTYENQQTKNRERIIRQKEKDREIAEKISQWRSEGGSRKEAKEKKIWKKLSSNIDERTKYQMLKKEQLTKERIYKDAVLK